MTKKLTIGTCLLTILASSSAFALTVNEADINGKTDAVSVRQISTDGQASAVLTDAQGMTLYTFSLDSPGKSACSGGCLTEWPPLTVSADAVVASPFGVITGNSGDPQLTLEGLPLYHFAGDSAPGDMNGNYPRWESVTVKE